MKTRKIPSLILLACLALLAACTPVPEPTEPPSQPTATPRLPQVTPPRPALPTRTSPPRPTGERPTLTSQAAPTATQQSAAGLPSRGEVLGTYDLAEMGLGAIDRAIVTESGNHVILASMGGLIWMDAREAGFGAVFNSPAEYVMTNSISTRDTDDFPLVADFLVRESGKVTLYAVNRDGISQAVKVLDDPARIIFSLAFSADGSLLAVGYHDGTLKLFDTANGTLLQTIAAHNDNLTSLAFSPDGRQVITDSWSFDGFTYVWDTSTGARVATLSTESYEPGVVSFSMDGFQASATAADGTHIFSTRTWEEAGPVVQGVWEGKISCDGRMLMVPAGNGMDFYSLDGGDLVGTLNAGPMYCLHSGELVAFEYDGNGTKVQMVEYAP